MTQQESFSMAQQIRTRILFSAVALLVANSCLAQGTRSDPSLQFLETVRSDAAATNCTAQFGAVVGSDLVTKPADSPLRNPVFRNIEHYGRPSDALNLFVAEPHERFKAALKKEDLESGLRDLYRLTNTAPWSSGAASGQQWASFKQAVLALHYCNIKAWYRVDVAAQARMETEARSREEISWKSVAATQPSTTTILCTANAVPKSRGEATLVYEFAGDGSASLKQRRDGFKVCKSSTYTWKPAGDGYEMILTGDEGSGECGSKGMGWGYGNEVHRKLQLERTLRDGVFTGVEFDVRTSQFGMQTKEPVFLRDSLQCVKAREDSSLERGQTAMSTRDTGGSALPAVSPGAAKFVVEVGSTTNADDASKLVEQASKSGVKTYSEWVSTANGKVMRVRAGPYSSQDEAKQAVGTLRSTGFSAWSVFVVAL